MKLKLNIKTSFLKNPLLLILIVSFNSGSCLAQNDRNLTKEQWLEDLNWVVKTLNEKHIDLYYRISKEEFKQNIRKAEEKIKLNENYESCVVAIKKVVASIYDGHTVLGVGNLAGYQDIFPVRMYEFSDGIFITAIDNRFANCLGAKVIKIGEYPAKEAFLLARTLAHGDNEFYKKEQAPLIVITNKLAFGLGIINSIGRLELTVQTDKGEREEIVLTSVTPQGVNNMLRGMDILPINIDYKSAFTNTGKNIPLYLKHLNPAYNYWFEHDKENKSIYIQYNLVIHQQNESFFEFYKRMFTYADENSDDIDKLILDLRFNNGGNGPMVIPFLNEIIKREKLNQFGHLYLLIGRRSFSAAVLLISEMMIHTNVLLVGEPTGAAQDMFTDMVFQGNLPNCGASLFVSSGFFNLAWPGNSNYMIPPHYPTPFSSSDFFAGIDPALEAIFNNYVNALQNIFSNQGSVAALNFFHKIHRDWEDHHNELSFTPATFPITKYQFGEATINDQGYLLMKQGKMNEAKACFELNTKMYPNSSIVWNSFAEYFYKNGDINTAIKYYEKLLKLNPKNQNAIDFINKYKN